MPANLRGGAQAPLLGLLLAIAPAGCWRGAAEPSAKTESGAEGAEAERAPLSDAFAAALSAGIRVNLDDPSTVEVDSFVATVVVEALLSGTTGLEIQPRLDGDGATQGFCVTNVAPGGPFARLGLRDGDVIAAINGVGLTSPGRALAVLRTARRQVVVAVERGDAAIFFDLRLVDGLAWSATLADHGDGDDTAPAAAPAIAQASALVAAVDDDALAEVAGDAPAPAQPSAPSASVGSGSGAGKPMPKTGGGASKPSAKSGGKPSSSSGASASGGSSAASCSSADDCTVRRSELDRILGNPSLASKQVRYTPHIQGGKHRGYRLTSVTRGSSVAGLGFRKGDVITAVNGHSLTDEGELFALYMGLSGTRTHKIRYQRGGATRVKTVRVQ